MGRCVLREGGGHGDVDGIGAGPHLDRLAAGDGEGGAFVLVLGHGALGDALVIRRQKPDAPRQKPRIAGQGHALQPFGEDGGKGHRQARLLHVREGLGQAAGHSAASPARRAASSACTEATRSQTPPEAEGTREV
jgi:hypothetical protein